MSYRGLLFVITLFSTLSFTVAHAAPSDKTITWAGCGITKKAFMKELAKGYEKKTGIKIIIHGGGATKGIRETASHTVDMGGSCRMTLPGSDRSELHVNLHPVAWDALAIIANKKNPVNNLTTAQIKRIYSGTLTNWKEVGGPDAPIRLYVRRGNISGVGYAIRQYIFKDGNYEFVTNQKYIVRSSGPLEKAVEKDPYAMGITGVSSARKRNVKILNFDGKVPSYKNVAAGKYTLYRPLYLVTSPSPSKMVTDFIKFATSKEGRAIMRKNGTVPYMDAPQLMSKMLIYGFDVR